MSHKSSYKFLIPKYLKQTCLVFLTIFYILLMFMINLLMHFYLGEFSHAGFCEYLLFYFTFFAILLKINITTPNDFIRMPNQSQNLRYIVALQNGKIIDIFAANLVKFRPNF